MPHSSSHQPPPPMRPLLLAAIVVAFAAPAAAQVSFIPMVGLDLDSVQGLGGTDPQIGVGFEYALTPGILPFTAAVRPAVHFVFVGNSATAIRVPIDLIGRFPAPTLPVAPYGKAGLIIEYIDFGNNAGSNTELGLGLGGGVEVNRFLAELSLGIGNVSSAQITAGYRF